MLCAFEALQSAYEQQHKAWQESYANLASMYESTKQEAEISRAAAGRLTRQVNGNAASGRQQAAGGLDRASQQVAKEREHRLLKALDRGWERGDRSRGFER
ncbi:MbeD/MobD family mobilization/exclusion protein [Klebsiella pneumoniae]|uniref:MbeD/MobD family mobilization/exclusion protein n=1 Tax=Klebsiella pneumoniae TaxID=573 RepID=UPI001E2C2F70|nr:MbeD/MobD family mobilization/exclusion protein [Klebsiella pneumoniae]